MEDLELKLEVLKYTYPLYKKGFIYTGEDNIFKDAEGCEYLVLNESEGEEYFLNWCNGIQEEIEYDLDHYDLNDLIHCIDWGKYFENNSLSDLDFNEVYYNNKSYYIQEL